MLPSSVMKIASLLWSAMFLHEYEESGFPFTLLMMRSFLSIVLSNDIFFKRCTLSIELSSSGIRLNLKTCRESATNSVHNKFSNEILLAEVRSKDSGSTMEETSHIYTILLFYQHFCDTFFLIIFILNSRIKITRISIFKCS